MRQKLGYEERLLLLIMLVGIVLRCFNLTNMPFMHDEFSALFRTRFDSFSDLINIGVEQGDTHPPGVQVFLWLYVQLVGENELLLKLPFVLMGIFSIPLTYNIGKSWFNKNVGLIATAFIASSQYVLTYSVIIRPYISGLFFCLFMVYYWTKIIKGEGKIKYLLGYLLFSVLSAYNHHFSLLFAFVVGVTGLFVIPKGQLLKYCLAGVGIVLLYSPNLSILLAQLNKGGLDGWLGAPSLQFPLEYLKYIFHFSSWNYVLVLFIFFCGLLYSWNSKLNKFYIISILWFVMPLLIGLIYSLQVIPIIQYSMLIFSFPFLLFSLFGLYPKKISKRFTGTIIVFILIVNVTTLLTNRQHYKVLYNTRNLAFLKDIDALGNKKDATVLIANHVAINDYYQDKKNWSFNYINYFTGVTETMTFSEVKALVQNSDKEQFIYGGLSYSDPELVQVIKEYFPFCIVKKDYYASHLFVFSKVDRKVESLVYFEEENEFLLKKENWGNVDLEYMKYGAILDSSQEWGPAFSIQLDTVLKHRNDVIDIRLNYETKDKAELLLVTEIKNKDSLWYYHITKPQIIENETKTIYKTLELSGMKLPKDEITFTTYIWNKNKTTYKLKNYSVSIRKGNPIQYSLFEPILENYEQNN